MLLLLLLLLYIYVLSIIIIIIIIITHLRLKCHNHVAFKSRDKLETRPSRKRPAISSKHSDNSQHPAQDVINQDLGLPQFPKNN
jgi:hypothetical protein